MEIYQLKTFVAVAQDGSITRAAERLFLSQPAASAHIKALEDTLGITLFDRTVRGMRLTSQGELILAKAEQTLCTHREILEEARRVKGCMTGRLRLGAGGSVNPELTGSVLREFSERYPEVEVSLQHCFSLDPLAGIRSGDLDAGFFDNVGEPDPDLVTIDGSRFSIYLVAQPGLIAASQPRGVKLLAELPWIYPRSIPCYEQAAENLFRTYQFRPKRLISVDRESVSLMLLAKGGGVGLLHENTAIEAQQSGDVEIVCREQSSVRMRFAYLASRAHDPVLGAVSAIIRKAIAATQTKARYLDTPAANFLAMADTDLPVKERARPHGFGGAPSAFHWRPQIDTSADAMGREPALGLADEASPPQVVVG